MNDIKIFRGLNRTLTLTVALLAALSLATGCTVRLAPQYDEKIESDLVILHKETEKFFEALLTDETRQKYDQCAGKEECPKAEQEAAVANRKFYVDTISGLRSVQMRAWRRRVPKNFITELFSEDEEPSVNENRTSLEEALRQDENGCDSDRSNEIAEQLCLLLDSMIRIRSQHQTGNGLRKSVIDETRPLIAAHYGAVIDAEKSLNR